jgi:hypothetical protein
VLYIIIAQWNASQKRSSDQQPISTNVRVGKSVKGH